MGNSFVFVDVSMEIVHGKFTSGEMAVTHGLVFYHGKDFVTAVNRLCVTTANGFFFHTFYELFQNFQCF